MSSENVIAAAAKIVADVVVYRVKKREAANLATSLTLALALGAGPRELGLRGLFGAALNVFVYLVNDCFDVEIDLAAEGRDLGRTRHLAAHRRLAWGIVAALGVALVAGGFVAGGGLGLTALVNIAVIFAYSRVLKHRALYDLVAMALWGVSMAMVGFAPAVARGWRLAGLLGLLSVVTECVQVLRDQPTDEAAGVKTTAVVLGAAATARLARAFLCGAALYAAVMIHPVGLVLALGVGVRLTPAAARRSWDQLRVLFGATWLVLMALVRWG
ncbi:MAG: UbiA family prenyltransferase [Myxococcales bacterium]|nr:UbiA family prenyltransferase [Myxococcales bacterium]